MNAGDPEFIKWRDNDAVWAPQVTLPPVKETEFQNWIKNTPWYVEYVDQHKELPNLDDPNYNYRAAWMGGAGDAMGIDPNDLRWHWPSSLPDGRLLKGKNHPTLWMEWDGRKKAGRTP